MQLIDGFCINLNAGTLMTIAFVCNSSFQFLAFFTPVNEPVCNIVILSLVPLASSSDMAYGCHVGVKNRMMWTSLNLMNFFSCAVSSCLPTPLTLPSGESPIFPLEVNQPAFSSIRLAVPSLQRALSTSPGVTTWCVCG